MTTEVLLEIPQHGLIEKGGVGGQDSIETKARGSTRKSVPVCGAAADRRK